MFIYRHIFILTQPAKKLADNKPNIVRINAGVWRSRLLKFPDAQGLRPTPERVRQTVFNWLGQDLTGLHCLDLFAGTGVMGFEALSRNAKTVTLIEKSPKVCQTLKANQILLKAQNASILQLDALVFLSSNKQLFDVVFLDPPYKQGLLAKVLPVLANHLDQNALVYAEAEYQIEADDVWIITKQGKAGNVYYHLLKLAHDISLA